MLFNSYKFILIYLPIVFSVFFLLGKYNKNISTLWLVVASIFFYAWWDYRFTSILLLSASFNYCAGYLIYKTKKDTNSRFYLAIAIATNLVTLGIFKYANFFIDTSNRFGTQLINLDILLPLGISFFTFTQIAFLVDAQKGIIREYNFLHYLLFVTWFPHLIAGPVIHHQKIIPQFIASNTYILKSKSISIGLTFFLLRPI